MAEKLTYEEARRRLFAHFATLSGWTTKPALKVPQAVLPSGDTLYFKPRAVYLNSHSLWVDIREYTPEEFVTWLEALMKREAK